MTGLLSIRTPDQRLRVFVSSTLQELAPERLVVERAIRRLRLTPVMFELGARPHPPRDLYRAYLAQSQVFVGIYWQRYGWVAPSEKVSGIEDEYRLSEGLPRLIYVKEPAPEREPRLMDLLDRIRTEDTASYRTFRRHQELARLAADDLALLVSERYREEVAHELPQEERQEVVLAFRPVPPDPTPLVGRQQEVRAALRLLASPDVRLVTLTGPAGVGKTRLAMAVGRQAADVFPGGAVEDLPCSR